MGQPTPPGDIPLFEGLGVEWNDIVGALPEDRRAELAPRIKERIDSFTPLKQWEDFQKSGITPEHAGTALNLFSIIENNPRQVYDTIGQYLNITPQQAKAVVEQAQQLENEPDSDPRIQTLQQQVETLAQIALAQRQMTTREQQIQEQDAAIESEISALKTKYGDDVDEEEILMRMLHKDMTAEQAFQEYSGKVTSLRQRRPAPMLMGSGGIIPRKAINPTKLDSAGTKDLVAQMMQRAMDEGRQ